jgi:hypothetical protein
MEYVKKVFKADKDTIGAGMSVGLSTGGTRSLGATMRKLLLGEKFCIFSGYCTIPGERKK